MTADQFVFEEARLYDQAFGYRDYPAEAARLQELAALGLGRPARSCLEVAAGPARHALALAATGVAASALDLSAGMCALAKQEAARAGVDLTVWQADMRTFVTPAPVELAFILLNSISHLHTLDDLVAHLSVVGKSLAQPGVYVLEVQHPRDFVGRGGRSTGVSHPWTVEQDGLRLTTRWGRPDDPYDPVGQLFSAHVELRVEREGETRVLEDVVVMRDWTRDELVAAARLAGMRVVHIAGDLDPRVPLDASDDSWRMVLVFAPA